MKAYQCNWCKKQILNGEPRIWKYGKHKCMSCYLKHKHGDTLPQFKKEG